MKPAAQGQHRLVPLSSIPSDGYVIRPEFWAYIEGELVFVTAVLERTVVYVSGEERKLTNRKNCWADPDELVVRPVNTSWGGRGPAALKGAAPDAEVDLEPDVEDLPNASGWGD